MVNILSFLEEASFNFCIPEEKGISRALFFHLAARCGYEVLHKKRDGKIFYKLKRDKIPCERLYSYETKSTFNFIDMADLHIGNKNCEVERIKEALRLAMRRHVDYVFIAGDVLDGVSDENGRYEEILERQLDQAYSIFHKLPLDVRVIPGNHDFSFDFCGLLNPLAMLAERLKGTACQFHVYNGYIQDFEMAGIIKRMIHLESYYRQGSEISVLQRMYEFDEHNDLWVKSSDKVKKPVRFLECGHQHKRVEYYDSEYNIYITQPGAFLEGQNQRMPLVHVKGDVLEDFRIARG